MRANDHYKGGEIVKRILSFLSLFAGIGVIAYCVYLAAVGNFENGFMLRNLQFFMVGFVLLALGIWGITKTKRGTAKSSKRRFPKVLIIIGSVILLLVLSVGVSLLTTQSNTSRIDKALRPYMREQYSETGAALPENARYILYDRAKDTFQYEARNILKALRAIQIRSILWGFPYRNGAHRKLGGHLRQECGRCGFGVYDYRGHPAFGLGAC
jgi:hypothetical protein